MIKCANTNTKEWKSLEARVGSVVAHSLFNEYNEDYDAINTYLDFKDSEGEKVDEESEFMKMLNASMNKEDKILFDILDRLRKVEKMLKDKTRDKTTATAIEKLGKIRSQIQEVESMQGIQEYIKSAAEITLEYRKMMDDIISSGDVNRAGDLAFINGFLGVFDNLKDLQLTMFREKSEKEVLKLAEWEVAKSKATIENRLGDFMESDYGKNKPIVTTETLDSTMKILESIRVDYVKNGRDLLAQRLFSKYDAEEIRVRTELKKKKLAKNPKDAYALSISTTWQELAEQMKQASKDIDGYERLLASTMGGSTNDFLALISRLVDDNQMTTSDEVREYEERLGKAHSIYSEGKNKNDVKNLNQPFIFEREMKVGDKMIKVKELHQKYDLERFKKDEQEFQAKFASLKDSNPEEFYRLQAKFYKTNKVAKANAEEIIEARRLELTDLEFEEWSKRNYSDYEGNRIYKGELSVPSSDYLSEVYKNFTAEQRAYYDTLLGIHEDLKLLLPKHEADKLGNRIPSMPKDDWRFGLGESTIKQALKDSIQFNEGDTDYGLVDLAGKNYKKIPFFFLNKLDSELASDDLLEVYLKASKEWTIAHNKMKILSEMQLAEDLMSYDNNFISSEKFRADKVNSKGENIVDPMSYLGNTITKEGETHIQNKFREILEDYYGIHEIPTIFSTPFGDISAGKLTNTVLKMTSFISLTGQAIGATVNTAMGNLNNLIESIAGEHIKPSDLAKGTALYFKNIDKFLGDRNKTHDKHWMTVLVEDFDLLHGEYINSLGENVSGNRLKRELNGSNLLALHSGGEHQIGVSNGLAYLNAIKWIDGKFIDRKSFIDSGGDVKVFEKSKSLLDAYVEGKGKLVGEYQGAWSVEQRQVVRNRVKEINKYVQGNYSASNKSALQRRWYGKLAEYFRKYVVSGFARRYGAERYNHATRTVMEGYYRSTFNFMVAVIKEMKEVGVREALDRNQMTPLQKANMRRVVAETASFFIVVALVSALTPDDDEEKNTYWENMSLLLARRMQSELTFYVDPQETWRIMKTPSIAMSTVGNITEFASGLVFKWGEDEEYQRDSGIWEKGDSKDLARAAKLIPGVSGILKTLTPEDGLKVFNR